MKHYYNETDGMYVIDIGDVNTPPEIIFELSSILDNEEAKNKRICLKLGNVDLNQAQLLSIKSLISGIDSTLSSIDTKSFQTEKVAMSLGIIISNISAQNTVELNPATPYKMAEDLKEENIVQNEEQAVIEEENYEIVEEPTQVMQETQTQEQSNEVELNKLEQTESEKEEVVVNAENKTGVEDELDVIFGSSAVQNTFYEFDKNYGEREALTEFEVPETEYTKEDIELETFPTKYIKQTIRSGQVINYEGNVVIIGDCHPGCEITAYGDITVWGVLSGIAHAGSNGNQKAKVRALKMNAIQLRIANCYSRRPDSLNTVYIEKTNSFTPEEARIINNEIVVFKIND